MEIPCYSGYTGKSNFRYLKDIISAKATMKRNDTWYVEIEVPMSNFSDIKLNDSYLFEVELPFLGVQLFRYLYGKKGSSKGTIKIYANHVFFDAQYDTSITLSKKYRSWYWMIRNINSALANQETLNDHPTYSVVGWYETKAKVSDVLKCNGDMYYLIPRDFIDEYAIEVPDANFKSRQALRIYDFNCSLAQKWRFYKAKNYDGYYYITSPVDDLVINMFGGSSASAGDSLVIYTNDDSYACCWNLITEKPNSTIRSFKEGYDFLVEAQYKDSDTKRRLWRVDDAPYKDPLTFKIVQLADATNQMVFCAVSTSAYSGEEYSNENAISVLFGSSGIVNKYVRDDFPCAMFDNFKCYFGSPLATVTSANYRYPTNLMRNRVYIHQNELSDNEEKDSYEDVVNAIIPLGYNGRGTVSGEAIYLYDSDSYSFKRIKTVTYDDIAYKDDYSGTDKAVYSNINEFSDALTNRAREDLLKQQLNETTKTIGVLDINNLTSKLKLNDVITLVEEENGTVKTTDYVPDKLVYNCCTNKYDDIDVEKVDGNVSLEVVNTY